MLYEIDTIYCSRCQKYVSIFDADNEEFSTKEIICSNCGKILMVVRSSLQTKNDPQYILKSLENHILRENIKTSKKLKLNDYFSGTGAY